MRCSLPTDTVVLTHRADLRVGYVHDLPASQPYDAATAILVMHFLPDDG